MSKRARLVGSAALAILGVLASSCVISLGAPSREAPAAALDGIPDGLSVAEAWEVAAGIEYDGSLDWRAPADTYRLGRGDCKDISALMVAMLERSGIEAYLVRLWISHTVQHMAAMVPGEGYLEPQAVGRYYPASALTVLAVYTLSDYLSGAGR